MHNNRAYHQEVMYVQDMAARANRGIDRADIGTAITDPNIDYATHGEGVRDVQRRPDHESERPGPAIRTRNRSREARRAGAGGRRHAAEVTHPVSGAAMTRTFCLTLFAFLTTAAVSAASRQVAQPGASSDTATTETAPTGNATNGKRLYTRDGCWQCHGYAGQGGRAVPDTVPLAGTSLNFAAFVKYVRQPTGAMPAYTDKVISEQELADVYAHIKTLPGPRPSAQIPLLRDLTGR